MVPFGIAVVGPRKGLRKRGSSLAGKRAERPFRSRSSPSVPLESSSMPVATRNFRSFGHPRGSREKRFVDRNAGPKKGSAEMAHRTILADAVPVLALRAGSAREET